MQEATLPIVQPAAFIVGKRCNVVDNVHLLADAFVAIVFQTRMVEYLWKLFGESRNDQCVAIINSQ